MSGRLLWEADLPGARSRRTALSRPLLADINNDGKVDVVVARGRHRTDSGTLLEEGGVFAFEWAESGGSLVADTLMTRETSAFEFVANGTLPPPVAANLDADDDVEVVVGGGSWGDVVPGEETARIHVFDPTGGAFSETVGAVDIPIPGRRFKPMYSAWTPVVGDIDGDGKLEIITATTHGWMVAWEWSLGSIEPEPGWPWLFSDVASTPVIADLDDDDTLDLLVMDESGIVHAIDLVGEVTGSREWWQYGGGLGNTSEYQGTTNGGAPRPEFDTLPLETRILPSGPNPFRESLTIRFELAESRHTSVRVFDVAGRLVETLWEGATESGNHVLQWNGLSERGVRAPSGVYFVLLQSGDSSAVLRAVRISGKED